MLILSTQGARKFPDLPSHRSTERHSGQDTVVTMSRGYSLPADVSRSPRTLRIIAPLHLGRPCQQCNLWERRWSDRPSATPHRAPTVYGYVLPSRKRASFGAFPRRCRDDRLILPGPSRALRRSVQSLGRQGIRPQVASQLICEFVYLYGAVSPKGGTCVYLIMPAPNRECFQIFLETLAKKYQGRILKRSGAHAERNASGGRSAHRIVAAWCVSR
jgi:hypothetical protein